MDLKTFSVHVFKILSSRYKVEKEIKVRSSAGYDIRIESFTSRCTEKLAINILHHYLKPSVLLLLKQIIITIIYPLEDQN